METQEVKVEEVVDVKEVKEVKEVEAEVETETEAEVETETETETETEVETETPPSSPPSLPSSDGSEEYVLSDISCSRCRIRKTEIIKGKTYKVCIKCRYYVSERNRQKREDSGEPRRSRGRPPTGKTNTPSYFVKVEGQKDLIPLRVNNALLRFLESLDAGTEVNIKMKCESFTLDFHKNI